MAAVLACGPGALLSHRSAAAHWGIRANSTRLVDVTVRGQGGRQRTGIRLHRVMDPQPDDSANHRGIPVTSVALTLLGLAQVLRPIQVERALEEAERLRILDMRAVHALVRRSAGRRGVAVLRAVALAGEEPPDIRSELERRFVDLCRRSRLPPPALNTMVAGLEVDALWRDERLVVELDGYEFHASRRTFERDRIRDADLQLAGYKVLRLTWRRIAEEPHAVVKILRGALTQPRRLRR